MIMKFSIKNRLRIGIVNQYVVIALFVVGILIVRNSMIKDRALMDQTEAETNALLGLINSNKEYFAGNITFNMLESDYKDVHQYSFYSKYKNDLDEIWALVNNFERLK